MKNTMVGDKIFDTFRLQGQFGVKLKGLTNLWFFVQANFKINLKALGVRGANEKTNYQCSQNRSE